MTYPWAAGEVLTAADLNAYAGLVLVKTQAIGTAVSSVTVTGAFSSTFENYRVIVSGGTQSNTTSMGLKLGSSTTGYYSFMAYGAVTSSTVLGSAVNNGGDFPHFGGGLAAQHSHGMCDLLGPNLARYTKFRAGHYADGDNYGIANGEHRVATAYTSFIIAPSAGTLTGGTIRVYGYNNG